jgi:hypothetical protein
MPKNLALRTLTALLFGVLALSLAKTAAAQSVSVADVVNRTYGKRPDDLQPNWVNHADCVGVNGVADSLIFQATLVGAGGNLLQVWVGSGNDCSLLESRTGSAPTCWLVYSNTPLNDIVDLPISTRDIVGRHKSIEASNGPGSGTLEDCDGAGTTSEPTAITFYFMFVDGGGNLVGTFDTYETKFDLLGPAPPTGISAGIGEDRLFVKWSTASLANDLLGYKSYCQAAGTAATGGTGGTGGTGVAGATGTGGTAGVTSDAAAGAAGASADASLPDASAGGASSTDGAAGDGGRAGEDGATTTGGSGGTGTGNPACPSALVAGEIPDPQYECGSTTSKVATKVPADGLTNFVTYAVAVAATDSVGNSGVLSAVVCGTPEPIDDFYELYTRAGGKGGGGFCALGADPANGVALLLLAACGALFVRRRIRG